MTSNLHSASKSRILEPSPQGLISSFISDLTFDFKVMFYKVSYSQFRNKMHTFIILNDVHVLKKSSIDSYKCLMSSAIDVCMQQI